MGTREELEAFCDARQSVQHLLYGDLSTEMVLFAHSTIAADQEEHEALLAAARHALKGAGALVPGGAADVLFVSEPASITLIHRSPETQEILVVRLSSSQGLGDMRQSVDELFQRLTSEEA